MPRAWRYGDNVDTDVIIPARYLTTDDEKLLASHVLEDLDAGFAASVAPGDIVVAGANFGCGSSREHAPIALKAAGVGAVVVASFARIFFRNAINTGLPVLTSPEAVAATRDGDELEIDVPRGTVRNVTREETFETEALPDFVAGIVAAGGLVDWVRAELASSAR